MNAPLGARRLIVLGASARAAAFSAARAGLEPYAIDLFADSDLAALCPAVRIERYPGDFLPALGAAPAAPWMYTGGLENFPRLVARMAEIRPLWGNGDATLRAVRDPARLAQALAGEGFPMPAVWSQGMEHRGRKWLVKPRRGSGGVSVRWARESDFSRAGRRHVIQQSVEGESCSATYVAAGGRAVLVGASRQLVGRDFGLESPFLYAGSIAPRALAGHERQRLAAIGNLLALRFRLVGLFGLDFIRADADIWPLEVNPRYTASVEILERVTGSALVSVHAAACTTGQLPPASLNSPVCAGKAVVYARRECEWPRDTELANSLGVWPMMADVPLPGQRFQAGQPMVTVFATGDGVAAVEKLLRERRAALLDLVEVRDQTSVQRTQY